MSTTRPSAPQGERAVPFHCPFCADENLRPHETDQGSPHGTWECRACLRAFSLTFLGLVAPSRPGGAP